MVPGLWIQAAAPSGQLQIPPLRDQSISFFYSPPASSVSQENLFLKRLSRVLATIV
jgi:hypothetical protein